MGMLSTQAASFRPTPLTVSRPEAPLSTVKTPTASPSSRARPEAFRRSPQPQTRVSQQQISGFGQTLSRLARDPEARQTARLRLEQTPEALSRSLGMPVKAVYALGDDGTVRASAQALSGKLTAEGHQEHQTFGPADLNRLIAGDKLTIVAHSSDDGTRLGGLSATQLAEHLAEAGLNSIGRISLKSCNSDAYAAELLQALSAKGISVEEISGRTGRVVIASSGRTLVEQDGELLHQTSGSKNVHSARGVSAPYASRSASQQAEASADMLASGHGGFLQGKVDELRAAHAKNFSHTLSLVRDLFNNYHEPDRQQVLLESSKLLQEIVNFKPGANISSQNLEALQKYKQACAKGCLTVLKKASIEIQALKPDQANFAHKPFLVVQAAEQWLAQGNRDNFQRMFKTEGGPSIAKLSEKIYLHSSSNPERAIEYAKALVTVAPPDQKIQAYLHVCGALRLTAERIKNIEAPSMEQTQTAAEAERLSLKALEDAKQSIALLDPSAAPKKARLQFQLAGLLQGVQPKASLNMLYTAVETARTQADAQTLLDVGARLNEIPGHRNEARSCFAFGMQVAQEQFLAQPSHADKLNMLDFMVKAVESHNGEPPHQNRLEKFLKQTVQDTKGLRLLFNEMLENSSSQDVRELGALLYRIAGLPEFSDEKELQGKLLQRHQQLTLVCHQNMLNQKSLQATGDAMELACNLSNHAQKIAKVDAAFAADPIRETVKVLVNTLAVLTPVNDDKMSIKGPCEWTLNLTESLLDCSRALSRQEPLPHEDQTAIVELLGKALAPAKAILDDPDLSDQHPQVLSLLSRIGEESLARQAGPLALDAAKTLTAYASKSGQSHVIEQAAEALAPLAQALHTANRTELRDQVLSELQSLPLHNSGSLLQTAAVLQSFAPDLARQFRLQGIQKLLDGSLASLKMEDGPQALQELAKVLQVAKDHPDLTVGAELLKQADALVPHVIDLARVQKDPEVMAQTLQLCQLYLSPVEVEKVFSDPLLTLGKDPAIAGHQQLEALTLARQCSVSAPNLNAVCDALAETALRIVNEHHSSLDQPIDDVGLAFEATRELFKGITQLQTMDLGTERDNILGHFRSRSQQLGQGLQPLMGDSRMQQLKVAFSTTFDKPQDLMTLGTKDGVDVTLQPHLFSSFETAQLADARFDKLKLRENESVNRVKQFDQVTVVHYNSKGHPGADSIDGLQIDIMVDSFTEHVAQKVQIAFDELREQKVAGWNASGAQLNRMATTQGHWREATKLMDEFKATPNIFETRVKAVFYDLQLIEAYKTKNKAKATSKTPYVSDFETELQKFGWKSDKKDPARAFADFKLEDFIASRKNFHSNKDNKDQTEFAAFKSIGMLHALAGYLVEERTYQLLRADYKAGGIDADEEGRPDERKQLKDDQQLLPWFNEKIGWQDQNRELLGGNTRPDLTLQIPGSEKHLLVDFTAFNSVGHILGKSPRWIQQDKVADSVEILYPSFSDVVVRNIIIEGTSLTAEQIETINQANLEKKQKEAKEELITGKLLRTVRNFNALPFFFSDDEKEGKNIIKHLYSEYLGYSDKSGKLRYPDEDLAKEALAKLKLKAKDIVNDPDAYGFPLPKHKKIIDALIFCTT